MMQYVSRSTQLVAATATPSFLVALAYERHVVYGDEENTENARRENYPKNTSNGPVLKRNSISLRKPQEGIGQNNPASLFGFERLQKTSMRHSLSHKNRNADGVEESFDINPIPLACGAFGTIHRAIDKRTGEGVAIKKISRDSLNDESFQREVKALSLIESLGGHPHICTLREIFDSNDEDGFLYLILELVPGGDLYDKLLLHGKYCEAEAARLIRGLVSALAYLHGIGVIHADLKPENLMLSQDIAEETVIKVVDFGSARIVDEDKKRDDYQSFTAAYCPPEALANGSEHSAGPPHDMWSVGVILYIMLTGVHPFDLTGTSTDNQVEKRIKDFHPSPLANSNFIAQLSGSAIDLITKLLDVHPDRRMSAREMLEHPWVQGEREDRD